MRWHRQGFTWMRVSVNLSPVQFRRGDVDLVVSKALQDSGLPASALELELTESLFIDESLALFEVLDRLRRRGVSLSIDDFGTGYSNLGYLQRFEVEILKIDQSFTRQLVENPQDEAIVRAIVQMAHSLNLTVLAEGIENRQTLERLVALGCDLGQGFLWAPGMPVKDFEKLLGEQASPV
jgi:EAL domain-containing protein (putative c-di-GMP-specific phosphodiesterase class I)